MVTRAGSASGGWARGEGAGAPWTRGAPRWASTSASTVRARSCRVWRKARQAEGQPAIRAALEHVEIGTIHTFQGGQHQVMLLSTVVAPGAKDGTVHWFEENKNLLNVAISRAKDLLIVVGHHARLEQAGGILAALVDHAARLAASRGALPPLLPGLQPERLGLLAGEQEILKHWLNPPGAVAEVLNGGEQELYRELL